MLANYKRLMSAGVAAVDDVHAEEVDINPLVESQHAVSSPDQTREEVKGLIAVLRTDGGHESGLEKRDGRNNFSFGSGKATLYIDMIRVPDDSFVRKGDVVIAVSRDGQPRFRVERVDRRMRGRLVLPLTALGNAGA